jgi:CHASE2 domain-containing sensor protein
VRRRSDRSRGRSARPWERWPLPDHGGAQFLGTIAGVILGTGLGTYLVLRRAQYLRPLLGGGAAAALVPVLAFLLLWAAPVIPALAGLCGTYLVVRMSPSPDA